MAKARLYSLNMEVVKNATGKTKSYVANLKGQAKIVFDEMRENQKPRLAVEIEKACGHKIQTRQDVFRVVLYYILVFKSKGIISTFEPDVENENENAFAGVIPTEIENS